ncbi:M23 family metallopeptidase [Actinomadura madurae]|nr:M23 family metallopeptidase [Actinomadura madurae]
MTTSDGAARPLGALAFAGGDGRVVAAGDGRLYRFCSSNAGALVMVIHPSGLATTYYHLRNVPRLRDGSVVKRGDALGRTGTGRPCGGAEAPRAQVGFGLRRGAEAVPLAGAVIGGWTFQERANPLLGFAERGVLQVLTGGLLANLGPVPAADDSPSSSPSPGATPKDGAGSAGAPAPAAT